MKLKIFLRILGLAFMATGGWFVFSSQKTMSAVSASKSSAENIGSVGDTRLTELGAAKSSALDSLKSDETFGYVLSVVGVVCFAAGAVNWKRFSK